MTTALTETQLLEQVYDGTLLVGSLTLLSTELITKLGCEHDGKVKVSRRRYVEGVVTISFSCVHRDCEESLQIKCDPKSTGYEVV